MTLAAVFPPMVTPFTNGEVDAQAIGWNVERWVRGGLGGVVALGTNGEAALLEEDEGDRVLDAVRQAVPRTSWSSPARAANRRARPSRRPGARRPSGPITP